MEPFTWLLLLTLALSSGEAAEPPKPSSPTGVELVPPGPGAEPDITLGPVSDSEPEDPLAFLKEGTQEGPAHRSAGGVYNLWSILDGGGGESAGGDYRLRARVGAGAVGVSAGGGSYVLVGSEIVGATASTPTGPAEIFVDGFESGDLSAWSIVVE